MATITLYADRVNQMPGLIRGAKTAVSNLNTQLNTLKKKCEKVNANVCNIEDVIRSISASTRTQEEKISTLETFCEDVEQFAQDTAEIDEDVAELINEKKDDFYEEYSYLKPDCEKSIWEKFCEGLKKVGKWCKEHWESIVTVLVAVIAAAAIIIASILTFGAVAVGVAALVGAAVGLVGKLLGDTIAFVKQGITTGKWEWGASGWEYFIEVVGAIFGGAMGGIMTLFFGPAGASAADSIFSSLLTDGLKGIFDMQDKTLDEIFLGAMLEGAMAAALGKLLEGPTNQVSKLLSDKIPALKRLAGKGSFDASYKMVLTKLKKDLIENVSIKTIRNGVISNLVGDFAKNVLSGFGVTEGIKDLVMPNLKNLLSHLTSIAPMPISVIAGA